MMPISYWAIAFALILARVSAFISVFPLFRNGSVPRTVKVALATSLSALWLANFSINIELVSLPVNDNLIGYALAIGREVLIGAMFGYALGLFILPAQIAGFYLGQEMGFQMAGITDPTAASSSNVMGDLFNALAMLLFLAMDIHHLAIGTLYASFAKMPLGEPLNRMQLIVFSGGMSDAHRWAMELAAPLGIALFLTTIILAVLMKISPQLNLFSIGTSLRVLVGVVGAFVFLPETLGLLQRIFLRSYGFVERLGM